MNIAVWLILKTAIKKIKSGRLPTSKLMFNQFFDGKYLAINPDICSGCTLL